ncbi:ABC transporter permease subunit [Euryarchaeota archaeon]|jgi:general L-amino acid transport system permease protein|nr:ABC transporter permease subunit [Euryarchaeota archaeon]
MQALRMNVQSYVQSYLSSAAKDPMRASRNALVTIIATLALWKYLMLFLGMSVDMSKQISLNIIIAGNPSRTYYPLGDQVLIMGGLCLFFFALVQNEISLQTLRNPRDYKSYIATLSGVAGLVLFWAIAENMELSSRTQAPFLVIGGAFLTGFLLIQDEMRDLCTLIIESILKPRGAAEMWKNSWRDVAVSIAAISLFFISLFNLSMLGAYIPALSYDQGKLFSFLMLLTIAVWLVVMSKESAKPAIVYKRHSSMAFLLSIPLLLFLSFRILLLMRTDPTWDVNWEFMDSIANFAITNWPNQVNTFTGTRWEFHWAGVINAVRVVLISIVLCTLIGAVVGVMRLSSHKLSSGFGTVYVEIFRNMPLALLLFTVSITVGNTLPLMADEVDIAGTILVSNQGIFTPAIDPGLLLIAALVIVLVKAYTTYSDRDGFDDSEEGLKSRFRIWVGASAVAIAIALSNGWDVPTIWKRIPESPGSWVVEGGFEITLPFICIIAGLTIYTSAIVAEIVRGSIQSLPRGQIEAGISLGLTPFQRLRLVIMPQALRSMVPALNNQYMNVWKNSSLAMVVAYNDIFYVNLVFVNKIGKAVPTFILILITYQIGSLVISAIMNWYNRRVTRVQI